MVRPASDLPSCCHPWRFSRAAKALHLTQPAVSDQVRKLEDEHDVLLFDRRKKQVTLTEFGWNLLEITNRLFEIEQQARDLLSESRELRSGRLNIMADSAHHLRHVLGPFREKYPGIFIGSVYKPCAFMSCFL